MKRIILILLLCLPMIAGAQTYSEIQTRLNANIWRDGTRFQTNTYRRFYSDTLNSLLNDMLDFTNGGFLPLTFDDTKAVSIGSNSLYISATSGPMSVSQLYTPAIIQQQTSFEDSEFIYGLYEIAASNGEATFTVESDGIDIGFELKTPYAAGDNFGFWRAKGVGIYEADYDSIMTSDLHIPDIGKVKELIGSETSGEFLPLTLTGNTTVSGDTTHTLTINANQFYLNAGGPSQYIEFYVFDNSDNTSAYLDIAGDYVDLYASGTTNQGITLSSTGSGGAMFYGKPARYQADYTSAMTTDRHIPDIGKVKSLFPLSKYDATAAPGTGDDANDGYSPGSQWVDITNKDAYICVDATVGAAVWKKITP